MGQFLPPDPGDSARAKLSQALPAPSLPHKHLRATKCVLLYSNLFSSDHRAVRKDGLPPLQLRPTPGPFLSLPRPHLPLQRSTAPKAFTPTHNRGSSCPVTGTVRHLPPVALDASSTGECSSLKGRPRPACWPDRSLRAHSCHHSCQCEPEALWPSLPLPLHQPQDYPTPEGSAMILGLASVYFRLHSRERQGQRRKPGDVNVA